MSEISARDARRVLLLEQGLLDDPDRKATPAAVLETVRQLGLVQLDSIPVVARAHDLTIRARLEGYRPSMLKQLVEERRALFEHWTHDASVIPVEWYGHWRHRFKRFMSQARIESWLEERLGENKKERSRILAETLERIATEGPLRSRDFNAPDGSRGGGWWEWKPHKVALEYLWWAGDLAICARDRFQKVYDLSERVFPELHARATPDYDDTIEFACSEALSRLGCATPAELADYFYIVRPADARQWCMQAVADGRVREVTLSGRPAVAARRFTTRLRKAERALDPVEDRLRLLAPFDPVVRDRARASRLFGFEYRFEAYVPKPKRVYGYYVLPILKGEKMIGRCDLKTDRERGAVDVLGLWWEGGKKGGVKLNAQFEQAVARLEECVLAE